MVQIGINNQKRRWSVDSYRACVDLKSHRATRGVSWRSQNHLEDAYFHRIEKEPNRNKFYFLKYCYYTYCEPYTVKQTFTNEDDLLTYFNG